MQRIDNCNNVRKMQRHKQIVSALLQVIWYKITTYTVKNEFERSQSYHMSSQEWDVPLWYLTSHVLIVRNFVEINLSHLVKFLVPEFKVAYQLLIALAMPYIKQIVRLYKGMQNNIDCIRKKFIDSASQTKIAIKKVSILIIHPTNEWKTPRKWMLRCKLSLSNTIIIILCINMCEI